MDVKRTERGWAGHFICANRCLFRRNTLLECGDIKIVVSTVGLMPTPQEYKKLGISQGDFEPIGLDRHYETMAFHASTSDTRYHDADVTRQIYFESPWAIGEVDADGGEAAQDAADAAAARARAARPTYPEICAHRSPAAGRSSFPCGQAPRKSLFRRQPPARRRARNDARPRSPETDRQARPDARGEMRPSPPAKK